MIEAYVNRVKDEMLLRFKTRDNLLKLQLIIQSTIFLLSKDFEVFGIKSSGEVKHIVILSPAISLLCCLMYFNEDRIIGLLSKYLHNMSDRLEGSSKFSINYPLWDASMELCEYFRTGLIYRVFIQLISFTIFPLINVWIARNYLKKDLIPSVTWILFVIVIGIAIFILSQFVFKWKLHVIHGNQSRQTKMPR